MQPDTTTRSDLVQDKHEVLSHVFGFDQFKPGQEPVIDTLLSGEDVLAVMPTGAGKSLCFQLPALMRGGLTVVVSPLIALMENQVALLESFGVRAGMIHSGRPRADNVADWRAVAAGEVNLVYMSPERMVTPRMIEALQALPLSMIVIDEAHCISQWGHDFRKEYIRLAELKSLFPSAQVAAFTATADDATRQDMVSRIFHGAAKVFVQGFDRPNIAIKVEEKKQAEKRLATLVRARTGQQGIVYCLSRKGTEAAADMLAREGHNAIAYHAGMADEERTVRLNRFLTEDDLVVCATIAFGMGIDKPDIRYVIHMNLPASLETYYQEIGRAGRDGNPAEAILFYGYNDLRLRRTMIDESGAPEDVKRVERRRLDTLATYCEAVTCRRNMLLSYFGELQDVPCGNCDICDVPPLMADGTAAARAALEAIIATGEVYGQSHIINILRGSQSEKVCTAGHDKLSSHGQGRQYTDKQWRRMFRQMLAQNILAPAGEFGSLVLTARGQQVLAGAAAVSFRQDALGQDKKEKSPAKKLAEGQVDAKLLTLLKQKRLDLAREKQCPAYVIFSDRTLIDMADKKPSDIEAFSQLFGVGDKKIEAYAETFLSVITEHQAGT
ncbi:DNA helicase RecQ [Parvularcula sp. IMCC14364]|uniref:DNA helicase RecQ n=1 Tax=Parvularcula sp. IMCC14364 TaxID=3067902 RepID=UPI0027408EEB|nr:DNA helicase RecQ [Parvularcula sp. IMCC14364]